MKLGWVVFLTLLMILAESFDARAAETIDFPEDELAQESVLPKFDRPDSVRRRNVPTESRFEFGGFYGWNILEPIRNQSKVGVNLGYHWSENSAFMLNYSQWLGGLNNQYTDNLYENHRLDFERTPKLKYSIYGHYEWKIFYGKISFTKQGVLNLSTYPIFGAGMTAYEHKNYPGVDFGIGQKFYFGKSFALRADFKLQYSQKPSPFYSEGPSNTDPSVHISHDPPDLNDFPDKWDLGTILDVGVSFLF